MSITTRDRHEIHHQNLGVGTRVMSVAFRKTIHRSFLALLALSQLVLAQNESPVQSTARSFGLGIVAPVQLGASDAKSSQFASEILPELRTWVNQNLGERVTLNDPSAIALDPERLFMSTASEARVYFVSEGAGYHNTLGYHDGQEAQLILPDASSRQVGYNFDYDAEGRVLPSDDATRTRSEPLVPGDFVDLGTLAGGTSLDFFLIGNGARGGQNTYSTDVALNQDGIEHVVAFALPGTSYLLIGFEDLWGGGDQDYNDLVFAVDIGAQNVRALGGPEPTTGVLLLSLLAFALFFGAGRRQGEYLLA